MFFQPGSVGVGMIQGESDEPNFVKSLEECILVVAKVGSYECVAEIFDDVDAVAFAEVNAG